MPDIRVTLHPDQFKAFQEWQRLREEHANWPGVSISAYKERSAAETADMLALNAALGDKAPLDPAFVLSQQIDDQAIDAHRARVVAAEAERKDRAQADETEFARRMHIDTRAEINSWREVDPRADAMEKRVDKLTSNVGGLISLLDRLTAIAENHTARLTAVEAAQRQPTTASNLDAGQADAPPVPTVNGWRLNVGPTPEHGRRVDILIEYPHKDDSVSKVSGEVVEEHTFSPVTWRKIIAWRYTK